VLTSALRKASIPQCGIKEEGKELSLVPVDRQNLSLPLPLLGCVRRLLLPSNALFVNEVRRQKLVQLLNDLYNIAFCKFLRLKN